MYPPSNHRKSLFYCCFLQSISPVQRKCTHLYTRTQTLTKARSEDLWLSIPKKNHLHPVEHRSQTPWSNGNWVSIFDWGLLPLYGVIIQILYHFAMRLVIVVKVSGQLSKSIKDQNASNNAPLSLLKLSVSYKGLLILLIFFIMGLKGNVLLLWRLVYLRALVHRHGNVFKRLFVVLLTRLEVKPKPAQNHTILKTVMGYGNTVMTFGDSAAPSKWMYFRLDQYKPNWTSTKRKQTHDENKGLLYQISLSIIGSNKDIYGYMDKLQLRDVLQYCIILWENACNSTAMKNLTTALKSQVFPQRSAKTTHVHSLSSYG